MSRQGSRSGARHALARARCGACSSDFTRLGESRALTGGGYKGARRLWQQDGKAAALADLALHVNRSTVCFYQLLGEGESEATALLSASQTPIDLEKGFKEQAEFVLGNADSSIPNVDANRLGIARGNGEANLALFREFDRVAQ